MQIYFGRHLLKHKKDLLILQAFELLCLLFMRENQCFRCYRKYQGVNNHIGGLSPHISSKVLQVTLRQMKFNSRDVI